MESLYLLIPMSLVLVIFIAFVLSWSIRSGQFDDMEGPAYQILMDDDGAIRTEQSDKQKISSTSAEGEIAKSFK